MPRIEFATGSSGPTISLERPEGGALVDVCDDARAPVSFSCRSASCGTCRVEVVLGAAQLEPAGDEELAVLTIFAAPPSHRVACQAIVRPGSGLLSLRTVDD